MTKAAKKPAHISQADWDAVDVPEWTDEDFARAKPFKDVFPKQYAAWEKQRGRPPIETPKKAISFRLAADVVDGIKASGRGYNVRVERALRALLAKEGAVQDKVRALEDKVRALEKKRDTLRNPSYRIKGKPKGEPALVKAAAPAKSPAKSAKASHAVAAPKKKRAPRKIA
jgi:uncharacterized protein (DUF4415 family)